MRHLFGAAVALMACVGGASADIDEIFIGRDAAGRLQVRLEGEPPIELNRSVFPGFTGWAEGQPGFEPIILDEPEEDFFVLSSSANLRWFLISADPGIQLLNEAGNAPMQPGESYTLGTPFFDVHPFWYINSGPAGVTRSLRIVVRDLSGLYADSALVDLPFTIGGCYANCDESTAAPALNVGDFSCFLQKFAAGASYANCDGSTAAPTLNVADFSCFLQQYAAGCP